MELRLVACLPAGIGQPMLNAAIKITPAILLDQVYWSRSDGIVDWHSWTSGD
jgi:hypothetical protein